jgi:hypothetical protein
MLCFNVFRILVTMRILQINLPVVYSQILAIWRPIGVHTTQFMFEHLWEIRSFFSVVLNSGTRLMGIRVHQAFYGLMGYS